MNNTKGDAEARHVEHHNGLSRITTEEDIKGHDFSIQADELPPGYFRSMQFLGSMFAIGLSLGTVVGGFALIAPILAVINADIGPDKNLIWVVLAYILTTGVCMMIIGRVTDIFGRRWWMIGGTVIALIGNIVCATAQNINALIAGEVLIGAGGSAGLSFAFTVNELVPMKYRFYASGYCFLWTIVLNGLSPLFAYAFVYHTSVGWRGCFYLLIALNSVAVICWILFYHPPNFNMKHGEGRKKHFIKHFDYIGTFVVTLGLLLLLMGLQWGGVVYPWKSAHVIATMIVGGLLLIAFTFYQAYGKLTEPLLPLNAIRDPGLMAAIIIWAIGASVYYAFAIVWPTMLTVLYADKHKDKMWPGYAALVVNLGIASGQCVCPLLPKKFIAWQLRASLLIGGILLASVASATPDTEGRAIGLMFAGTFFIGIVETFCAVSSGLLVKDQREIGTVIGFGGSMRSVISTICATIYTVVLSNRLTSTIGGQVPKALANAGLPETSIAYYLNGLTTGNATALAEVPGLTPAISAIGLRAYKEASMSAYRTVFYTTIAFTGLGLILSILLPNIDKLLTHQVATTLHDKTEDIVNEKAQDRAIRESSA